ncbi:glycosyltransferase family 2 protein [Pseudoalteromonas sp. MMG013]|uniref:glycosyltransferase family 2 protein n=1 Tax=Pseudoalteromonas sp. MMG013 TaxID=2822687 RepID=UPI001B378A2E|nr:glycosyltransferase family A protein [Pseudoalteromonas sp. MMG013]MBQ4863976.1 glycosyltransferase family 2 protein [Pseudoalteromonas sp. MMG013]
MNKTNPLISCLCITENRLGHLKNAYQYYKNQTYNNREFVVVCRSHDSTTVAYLYALEASDESVTLIVVESDCRITLGELRNRSIDAAQGEYICIWDDDDTHHPDRLTLCLFEVEKFAVPAVVLSNIIMHDVGNEKSYISPYRGWEATLFCEKRFLIANAIAYPSLNRGEDTPLIEALGDNVMLIFYPYLYIYKIHSQNTCPTEHFSKLIYRSVPLLPHESDWVNSISSHPREDFLDIVKLKEFDFTPAHRKPFKKLVSELAIEV